MHNTRPTLIERVQSSKDHASWEEFVETYKLFLYTVVRRMSISHLDTEEIIQTVFLKVWDKIQGFEYHPNKGKFRYWLCRIARNSVIDFIRKSQSESNKRSKALQETDTSTIPEVEEFALFIPAIETAMQYGGILTLHEYSAPVMTEGYGSALPGYPYHDDRGSLTFRYRWFYEELLLPRGLAIPLVISEAGIDGILGNRPGPPGKGWADFQSYAVDQGWGSNGVDAFINQLAWYDAGVRQDSYVLGFTVFTAGPVAQWGPYDIGPILPRMADYVRSQEW